VLTFSPTMRVFFAPGATDMRKAFDGLAAATKQIIGQDPLSGHLFIFCNRRRDRLKMIFWDRSGYWLFAKRLEKGTFAWPEPRQGKAPKLEMSLGERPLLLGGIDLAQTRRRRWLDYAARSTPAVENEQETSVLS
jgi:transposase